WEAGNSSVPLLGPVAFVKLGTAGLGPDAAWPERFAAAQRIISGDRSAGRGGASLHLSGEPVSPQWIAVAYADWKRAEGPSPEDVVGGAHQCTCSGVLIDTYGKENGGLFDWLSVDRLTRLAAQARGSGLEFALAGRLQIADAARLAMVRPDIVGIRS